ncbi:MAG: hypothetical protein AAF696_15365 [Bacteroidota bacterium]
MDKKTPILFLVFNRPEPTAEVFEAIRSYKPERLYVAADGARKHKAGEEAICEETRAIALAVDWPCEVKTLLREENLGCKHAVSSAINWFFEEEEQGIILEDDCVPHSSFFDYCTRLLDQYKEDERVMHIAGSNHHPDYTEEARESYYFSYYGHMWGWASWRRAWANYDLEMEQFEEVMKGRYLEKVMGSLQGKYLGRKLKEIYYEGTDTWDYQWDYSRLLKKGLTIIPKNNLVNNIGFGEDATHTFSSNNEFSHVPVKELEFPMVHPSQVARNKKADQYHFLQLLRWIFKRKIYAKIGIKGYDNRG